jgi:PAS domain S-box-containing protein
MTDPGMRENRQAPNSLPAIPPGNSQKSMSLLTPDEAADLEKSKQEIECLLSSLSTILIVLSMQRDVYRWNPVAEKILGIAAGDIVGHSLSDSEIQWDWAKIEKGIATCQETNGTVRVDDIVFTRSDGKQGYLGITINPFRMAPDQLIGFIIIGADITDRKAMEDMLAQTEKLKSIGQLAAGIAHEINTPTQYVGDNTRFLQDALQDIMDVLGLYGQLLEAAKSDSITPDLIGRVEDGIETADVEYLTQEIPTAIEQTLEGVDRIGKIVRAMKEFSHPGQEEKTPIDINNAIESTITVARNEWKYVADMVTEFDAALPPVPCLPGEFNQVILNLIINAAHAIADVIDAESTEKGSIRIRTRKNEKFAEIVISDTGGGIPENIRQRIFDPFFTTKDIGKGTGQGLAITHSVIIEKHGGTLNLESTEGKGTTFSICLPLEDNLN